MPQVSKLALSHFIRTNCMRQLAMSLYPDNARHRPDRKRLEMPYPQAPLPGLRIVQKAGDEWQKDKLDDLAKAFSRKAFVCDGYYKKKPDGTIDDKVTFRTIRIAEYLPGAAPFSFVIEGEFGIDPGGAFETALDISAQREELSLEYSRLRPDIIEVLPPAFLPQHLGPGGEVKLLPRDDRRKQLRIIDIKLTADPSPSYFAEVALYSMALAGWLVDRGHDSEFVVAPNAALWPGSHQASSLFKANAMAKRRNIRLTNHQLWTAMQEDLESVPFEVFALRVRKFLRHDVPAALAKHWREQQWHVDTRCSYCEYLGEERLPGTAHEQSLPHPNHCLPMAQRQDHLSRVAFVSQGARIHLNEAGIEEVADLAGRPAEDAVFNSHQTLRATRTVIAKRAAALRRDEAAIDPQSGSPASLPRWADLRIYLSVDFDLGSAITVAFGLKAYWRQPRPRNSPLSGDRLWKLWRPSVSFVLKKDLATEQRMLLEFLGEVHNILTWCKEQDAKTLEDPALSQLKPGEKARYHTTMQVYLWDKLQFDHLARVIGRHLEAILADQNINYLAWLFPPDELVPNAALVTRQSPTTMMRDAVRSHLAAPIPHHYSLFDVARQYHEPKLPDKFAKFNVPQRFRAPLSDQIPSERAHEIWTQAPKWNYTLDIYEETVKKRLAALETITKRLEMDMRPVLKRAAPYIRLGPPEQEPRVSADGQLWLAHTRLDVALGKLEVQRTRFDAGA